MRLIIAGGTAECKRHFQAALHDRGQAGLVIMFALAAEAIAVWLFFKMRRTMQAEKA